MAQSTYNQIIGTGSDDWLSGNPQDVLALAQGGIKMAETGAVYMSMGTGSYAMDHTLFAIMLDPETQSIVGVDLLWPSTQAEVGDLSLAVNQGEILVFGMLENGGNLNDFSGLSDGMFDVTTNDDGGFNVIHISDNGAQTNLQGTLQLSTTPHTATGRAIGGLNTVQIGFEDGYGGNDGDFNDITFTATVGNATAQSFEQNGIVSQSNLISGGHGEDALTGGSVNDLLAGGGVGNEWQFIDGEWTYDPTLIPTTAQPVLDPNNDTLLGGDGNDVLLGNRGDDVLRGGNGRDTLNGGVGDDIITGGSGADIVNLEDGNDVGIGGDGADIVNAGVGDDTIYGDLHGENLLVSGETDDAEQVTGWVKTQDILEGKESLLQTIQTAPGHSYTLSVDVSANLSEHSAAGTVEVLWNGSVVAQTTVTGAVSETLEVDFVADGDSGVLEIRSQAAANGDIDASGAVAIVSTSAVTSNGVVELDGFAAGQSHLYQVLNGQLTRLDPSTGEYTPIGDDPGLRTNAVGFNMDNNLLYGVSSQAGVDVDGQAINAADLLIYDANGAVHRVGSVSHKDVVGDFDNSGHLWTFDASLDRITKINVDMINADGQVHTTDYLIDTDAFPFRVYDLTYNAQTQTFFGVKGASEDGQNGMVVQIDVSDIDIGGDPVVTTYAIEGTIYNGHEIDGVPKGSFGAAFSDGDGNVYVGMNRGNHDLDADTPIQGAMYHLKFDPNTGAVTLEYVTDTDMVTSNDGAMDPRGTNPFGGVESTINVMLDNITLVSNTGEADMLRGAAGKDVIFGGGGADIIHAGTDNDRVSGDQGADVIFGGAGNDVLSGGADNDHLEGGDGHDTIGGGVGNDVMMGRLGSDSLIGDFGNDRAFGGADADEIALGQGADRGFGGSGDDRLDGGDGNDHLEGGIGHDTVMGAKGSDFVKGADGDDVVFGGAGDDRGYGGTGSDTMAGGGGVDMMVGNADADYIFGNEGNDILKGGSGVDTVMGGENDDMLFGGTDADHLFGGIGQDRVIGGSGADTLHGGKGEDHLWGGNFIQDNSADIFVYVQGDGKDMVHDFESHLDRIDLSSYGMTFEELQARITDLGWAAEIDLSDLATDGGVDRIILRSVAISDLAEDNFIL